MKNKSSLKHSYPIPDNYKLIKILGKGGFGTVIKCIKLDTNEKVAVKISNDPEKSCLEEEACTMKHLMANNMDKFNTVKFYGELRVNGSLSLEYEALDISLLKYIKDLEEYMPPEEIRSVIQELAVAFDALKRINVIHTDLKLDNILLVDRLKRPLRVKLIDFGLAIPSETTKQGDILQILSNRAPEIILGLPFSESIDIWSLGIVLAAMMYNGILFSGRDQYQTLRHIIELLGPPPEDLLNAGWRTEEFFKKTTGGSWILKTPEEYYSYNKDLEDVDSNYSLDALKADYDLTGVEWGECNELLKAMLQWDEKDRITPSGILNHPFITKSYSKCRTYINPQCTVPSSMKAENIRMDEELKKKDEEIKRMTEESKRKNKEIKKNVEEVKRMNKEIKRKNKEIKRMNIEIKRKNEEIKRMNEEIERKNEEIKRKNEDSKKKDEEMQKKKKTNFSCFWSLIRKIYLMLFLGILQPPSSIPTGIKSRL